MAEGAEELIEERLRLALFVAFQRTGEGGKRCEGGLQFGRGHGAKNAGTARRKQAPWLARLDDRALRRAIALPPDDRAWPRI
jgi:hypothetical protein